MELKTDLPSAIAYYRDVQLACKTPAGLREVRRRFARGDLFFLAIHILGRYDMCHPWIFDRCREVQAAPDNHLDLWSRDHYKSSCITFAQTIRDILCDPEITVGIFSHTRPIAKAFLRQIKREFEINVRLRTLFDDILWDNINDAPSWSEDGGITVRRKTNPKEQTIEAYGLVDGQPTSKHFQLRIYDDAVTRESVTTQEQINKTIDAWELSDNLGTANGKVRYIGTRYHLADLYSVMLERDIVTPRVYPATHNGRMDGTPVLLTQAQWDDKKKKLSRKAIASQLLQNPLADEDAVFSIMWLRSYDVRPRLLNVAIMCDPSRGRNATSDNTALAVIGIAADNKRYMLDGYCHRMTLSQRWAALRDMHKKWSLEEGILNIRVGYERYGAQSDDEYFQERMIAEKYPFEIKELNWTFEGTRGEQGKTARVERLEPDFRNGRFFLPNAVWRNGAPHVWSVDEDIGSKTYGTIQYKVFEGFTRDQRVCVDGGSPELITRAIKRLDAERKTYDLTLRLIEEYSQFPFGAHDDLIDVVSRVYDMEMTPPMIINKHATEPGIYHDS